MDLTATAPAAETKNTATPARALAAPSFLVIDDDPVHRMVISRIGEKAGYTITAVAAAETAAAELRKQKFDCISLDLSLGGTNGALLLNDIATHNSQALLIVIIIDDKTGIEWELFGFPAQQPGTDGVEGAQPEPV